MKKFITLSLVLFYSILNFATEEDNHSQLTPRTTARIVYLEQQVACLHNQRNPKEEPRTCCDSLYCCAIIACCFVATNQYIDHRIDMKLPPKKMD